MREENPNPLSPAESELEAALARLAPTPANDRRDEIAYEAGRRAGRRSTAVWRTCSGALAACLAAAVVLRPEPRTVERVVYAPAPSTPALVVHAPVDGASRPVAGSYLALRDDVLAHGLGALPASGTGSRYEEPARAVTVQTYAPRIPSLFGERL
jgi:hypothetical protein